MPLTFGLATNLRLRLAAACPSHLSKRPRHDFSFERGPVLKGLATGGSTGSRQAHHVAVVGSGPAGFYTTKYLFKQAGADHVKIDMYERLPTPYGLVRFGVAPDHPEVKNVTNDFTSIASTPGFRFFGNVAIGSGPGMLSLDVLRKSYDAVVVCTGAEGERHLGIPGEDLRGVVGAPPFVKWYNGHPDYVELGPVEPGEAAVVVGHGNVAIDVARILARAPSELRRTDIDSRAIAKVAEWQQRGLRTIHLVGRRGFVQAAFTNAELRELLTFSDEAIAVVDPEELALSRNDASEKELAKSRMKKRSVDILEKMAANFAHKDTTSKRVIWLRFLASPTQVVGSGGAVSGIRLARTRLEGEPGAQSAVEADPGSPGDVVPCGLVVRSVGFGMTPLEGLPSDERRRVPHVQGRVVEATGSQGGIYVSGWAKRGPTGIIASNIGDAQETAGRLLKDLAERSSTESLGANVAAAEAELASTGRRVVSFADWQRLEAEELRRGTAEGRPAVKFTDIG
eukprot:CAMPEP_0117620148 /NCGR_PEP_ID=MMETSP0784-20121206/86982_1 /TAXON_ID=39447 /ORGANISM="" /LENGTH=510 /DNA_ID=CAMNT_0005424059 /DNA_START=49 /DNA_END=1577 /DNA_ORIENTATION=+